MSARTVSVLYWTWLAALTTGYFAWPAWAMLFWTAIGLTTVGAIIAGIRRNRPRRQLPWLLMAAGLALLVAGDTAYDMLTRVFGQDNPFPSIADVFYLAALPALATGLVLLARAGVAGRHRASVLDALTVTLGIGLLSWIFVIQPHTHTPGLTGAQRMVSIAYPLGDVLILLTVVRVLSVVRRSVAASMLVVAAAALLVSDFWYSLNQLGGGWQTSGLADFGWLVCYAAWGGAALHPSMTRLSEPRVARGGEISPLRLGALAAASLVAPAVLLAEALTGTVTDGVIIATLSAAMFILVLSRLAGLVATHRQALARAEALRDFGAALVAAADAGQVLVAVRAALPAITRRASLAGGRAGPPLVLLGGQEDPVPDAVPLPDGPLPDGPLPDGRVSAVVPAGPGRQDPTARPGGPRSGGPGGGHRGGPRRGPRGGPRGRRPVRPRPGMVSSDDAGRSRLVPTEELPAHLAGRLGGFSTVLRCPLATTTSRPGGRAAGELLVAAEEEMLVELLPVLEVLASQAALALDRIALSDEVNRRISEEYFRTLVHHSTDVILILGEGDGDRIRYASPSATRLLGQPTLVGVRLLGLVVEADRPRARSLIDGVLDRDLSTEYEDWTVVRADGGQAEVEVSCRDLRDDPTVAGLVVTLRDVTERRRLEAELTHRALHDSLTGLANRVLFHDRTHRAVQRAHRNGTLAGVLFVDLDDFKVVNDTLGHARGDELLVAVGRRLDEVLREHDTAARLGGDEFAILVEDATHPADIEQVAERVLAALAVPVEVGGEVLSGNASVGVAISTDATDAPDLLRQADLALYLAKSDGKQRWRRYNTTLHTALLQRLEVRAALDQAIANEQFVLHYQPIVEMAGRDAVGFEALVRWDHPERGLVPPGEFIEVAEESGLIVPIGAWVMRTAVATAAGWRRDHPGAAPYVSVNVSARQFRAPGFMDEIRGTLAAEELPPQALLLEITESLLLRDDEQVWTDLATLQALGVRIAIDDFGTGYSSLSYLRQMPIDVVKIDRSFVRSMAGSPQQAALVDGIIRLAHTMGLAVVAEGVEETAQRDLLLDMGCQHAQGFLFARPLPVGELAPWLAPERVRA
jgi:diguanylate cyclase (GGDEF)-like protein/PAS domain S-box-containing protein